MMVMFMMMLTGVGCKEANNDNDVEGDDVDENADGSAVAVGENGVDSGDADDVAADETHNESSTPTRSDDE